MALVVDAQDLREVLDVLDRGVGVPAVVHVDRQRTQPVTLGDVGCVGAVHSAADAEDAVVPLAPGALDPLDHCVQLPVALFPAVAAPGDTLEEVAAVIAVPGRIEGDVPIARVHHAARALPEGPGVN